MSLRESCDGFVRSGVAPLKIGRVSAGEELARRLAESFTRKADQAAPVEEIDAVARRLDAALAEGAAIGRRDRRLLPWCLWEGALPLADRPGRLEAALGVLASSGRRRSLAALAEAWAGAFEAGRPGIAAVADFLAARCDGLGEPWAGAAARLGLFDPAKGPAAIAGEAVVAGDTPDEVLRRAGFERPEALVGLRRAAFRAGFAAHAATEAPEDAGARLALLERWAFDESGRPRFEELRAAAVTALLAPHAAVDPPRAVREAHLDLVLRLLGDPRVEPMRWNDCAAAEAVVRRWLTGFTLRQFFDVVDAVAPDPHWRYRRAFWTALLDKDLIEEAVVVLDPVGAETARRLFGDVAFARFDGRSPLLPGQAALIMRIDGLIAVEWSHTSPIALWDEAREAGAPPLDRAVYDAASLKKKETAETARRRSVFKHVDPQDYVWQREVAEYLRVRRAVDLSLADYVVDW